jgi:hypothetical protein
LFLFCLPLFEVAAFSFSFLMHRARKLVGVQCSSDSAELQGLFGTLAELFPVEFREHADDTLGSLDAVILLRATRADGLRAAAEGVCCLAFLDREETQRISSYSLNVQFAATVNLHPCLRRQVLTERAPRPAGALQPEPGDEVVASRGSHPVWLHRAVGKTAVDFVSGGPPAPTPSGLLREQLCGLRFMFLLPLLNFLQELTRESDWKPAPLRACLVLDDPNLHYRSYGCINFRQLAAHAKAYYYHVAIATVPFDAWHVSRDMSMLFRENPASLSILIHGNNHTKLELARPCSARARRAVLAQALKRVEVIEERHKLRLSRVMEAPHGGFSISVFALLASLGYEAALVTPELLLRYDPSSAWAPGLGMEMAEMLPGGLAGIPRVRLDQDWKTEALLAAFLGQPIVVAGHHYDAAGGMSLFGKIAETINGLGDVQWSDTQSLARTNYKTRQAGDHLSVKMYSRRVTVSIPEGVRQLTISRPWIAEGVAETLVVGVPDNGAGGSWRSGMVSDPIPVTAPATWEIRSISPNAVDYRTIPSPRTRLWPIMRKALVEIRDRTYPVLHRQRAHRAR